MNLEIFLSLFSLMLISLGVFVASKRLRIPYTVLLVIVGSLLVPLSKLEALAFITSFELTPELLFFVFLPILIFESAYSMNISKITENIWSIGFLAIGSLLLSTVFIGVCGHYVLHWIGFDIPILVTMLFGAIISATDPVAVLALFKEYGAPRRLTLMFEGESLFNDGTSFAAFLVILDIFINGFAGTDSIVQGLLAFVIMVSGGALFGFIMGFFFAKLIEWVRGNEHLEITLTLLVAHFTFVLTELISEHFVILGQPIRLSSIIATLVACMIIGNFGRFKMSTPVEEYMEKFWSYFAFVANSLVFILMGLLFTELSIGLEVALLPIILMIITVAVSRAASIYPVLAFINQTGKEEPIPPNWMHLLAWGSLRGSLAVIMVQLIPDNVTLPGWSFGFSVKEFIASITIGSIYFTLLVKATSIGWVMRKLGINTLSSSEEIGYYRSQSLIYQESLATLQDQLDHNQISFDQYEAINEEYRERYQQARQNYEDRFGKSTVLIEKMLRLYLLGYEKDELKEMFHRNEINEKIYKKILHMIDIQMDRLGKNEDQLHSFDERFPPDLLEKMIHLLRKCLLLKPIEVKPEELYIYYRTLDELIEKIIKQIAVGDSAGIIEIFDDAQARARVLTEYQALKHNTRKKMEAIVVSNYELLNRLNETTARQHLQRVQEETLVKLNKNGIISNNLFIHMKEQIQDHTVDLPDTLNTASKSTLARPGRRQTKRVIYHADVNMTTTQHLDFKGTLLNIGINGLMLQCELDKGLPKDQESVILNLQDDSHLNLQGINGIIVNTNLAKNQEGDSVINYSIKFTDLETQTRNTLAEIIQNR